ncbi:MAG: ATP-binding cassette domain-containing protein [Candidatus Helarchaeota archaeon]
MKSAEHIIEIEHLFRYYGNFCALKDISIKIKHGAFGLLGPNGAGKTTTISILTGLLRPHYGSIKMFGELDYYKDGIEIRQRIGFLPERNFIFLNLTARKFLMFMGRLYGLPKNELKKDVEELLKSLGLGEWINKPAAKFSGGMRQRLGLAGALINKNAELYFFDEPTSNMDPLGRVEILDKIKELVSEGKSFIYCSHILPEVERVCKDVAIMNEGEIIESGKISELSRKLAKNLFKIKVSDSELLIEKLNKEIEVDVTEEQDDYVIFECENPDFIYRNLSRIISQNDIKLYHFETVQLNLEQIFKKLVIDEGSLNEN